MREDQDAILAKAVKLVNAYHALERAMRDSSHNKTEANKKRIAEFVDDYRLIGEATALFGGHKAMRSLNDRIISAGGDISTVNDLWIDACAWMLSKK